jgi:putative DNA primase/helicase
MISPAELAAALGGRRHGARQWQARCPAHDDRDPSLSITESREGVTLVHCFAGCEQGAVIDALRARGLWNPGDEGHVDHSRRRLRVHHGHLDRDDAARKAAALDIWNSSIPASGTPVETYLRSRGITLPAPPALRFHGALMHTPTNTVWPAMVALVTGSDGKPLAIHRTYLALDGKAKAPITPQRMTLGCCRGGAVRLGEIQHGKSVCISEGIETGLSVAQACELPVWAALSAEGMKRVVLPAKVQTVTLCADNDASCAGYTAANAARKRLIRDGRKVRIAMPPETGTDFNDLLGKRHV